MRQAEIVDVGDARAALERVQAQGEFDLILRHRMMPVVTGMDLYVE